MMPLCPGISVAPLDDRVILLDAKADRYRLVTGRKAAALSALASGQVIDDEAALDALVADGVLRRPLLAAIDVAHSIPPASSAIEMPASEGCPMSAVAASHALATVVLRQKLGGFFHILQWAEALKQKRAHGVSVEAVPMAQSYARIRALVPLERICLRDSVALFALLLKGGVASDLVFGVKLDPFAAHCWVQAGSVVLSDTLWSTRSMRPIIVL